VGIELVLYERVSVVEAAFVVIVVMEEVVFESGFSGYGSSELRELIGLYFGIERDF
jgi:hypothetical protein